MAKHIDVMISSTARDLPIHREEVKDACLRLGMFPIMMEHLPASDADAIATSLKMVDDAEIYIGIFAYRYGYVPKRRKISITEMEYNRVSVFSKKYTIFCKQMICFSFKMYHFAANF